MKKILKSLFALLMVCGVSSSISSCDLINKVFPQEEKQPEDTTLEDAKSYLWSMYKDVAEATTGNFTVLEKTVIGDKTVNISWEIKIAEGGLEVVKLGEVDKSSRTIEVTFDAFNNTKATNYELIATLSYEGETASVTFNHVVPQFVLNTYAEVMAAAKGDIVAYKGVLTAKTAAPATFTAGSVVTDVFVQGADGAVLGYKVGCTSQEEYDALVVGGTYILSGTMDWYYGVPQITSVSLVRVGTDVKSVDYTDISSVFSAFTAAPTDVEMEAIKSVYFGQKIEIKDVVAEAIDGKFVRFHLGNVSSYLYLSTTATSNIYSGTTEQTIRDNWVVGAHYNVKGICYWYSPSAVYILPEDANCYEALKDNSYYCNAAIADLGIEEIYNVDGTEISLPASKVVEENTVSLAYEVKKGDQTIDTASGKFAVSVVAASETVYTVKVTATLGETVVEQTLTVKGIFPTPITIAEFKLLEQKTAWNFIEGTVVAASGDHDNLGYYMLCDETGVIEIYDKAKVAVGDKVLVYAQYQVYNNLAETFGTVKIISGPTAQAEYNHAPLKVVNIDDISTDTTKYDNDMVAAWSDQMIKVSGKLVKSGDYYYVQNSSSANAVSIYGPNAAVSAQLAALVDSNVDVYGYTCGSGKGQQKLMVTDVLAAGTAVSYTHFTPAKTATDHAGTAEDPFSIEDADWFADKNVAAVNGTYSDQEYYIEGTVKTVSAYKITDTELYDYTITFEGGKIKLQYALLGADVAAPAVGDKIVFHGYLEYYNSYAVYPKNNKDYTTGEWPVIVSNVRGTSAISVAADSSDKATVEFSATSALNGTQVTFTVAATTGYDISVVKVNGKEVTAVEGVYTIEVAGPMSVKVETAEQGAVQPVKAASISFASLDQCTSYADAKAVWTNNSFTITNEKNTSQTGCANSSSKPYVNPTRIYKGQTLTFAYTGIVKIVVHCASGYADEFVGGTIASGCTMVQDGDDVVISVTSGSLNSILYNCSKAATRIVSVDVYVMPE